MSEINDTLAANNQEETPVEKNYPIHIVAVVGKGETAEAANINAIDQFQEQLLDFRDTITGNLVVVGSGSNYLLEETSYSVHYWAMVRISPQPGS